MPTGPKRSSATRACSGCWRRNSSRAALDRPQARADDVRSAHGRDERPVGTAWGSPPLNVTRRPRLPASRRRRWSAWACMSGKSRSCSRSSTSTAGPAARVGRDQGAAHESRQPRAAADPLRALRRRGARAGPGPERATVSADRTGRRAQRRHPLVPRTCRRIASIRTGCGPRSPPCSRCSSARSSASGTRR